MLVKITEQMTALMKSQSDHDQEESEKVLLAIGECNAKEQKDLGDVNGEVASVNATADHDQTRMRKLEREISETTRRLLTGERTWRKRLSGHGYLVTICICHVQISAP